MSANKGGTAHRSKCHQNPNVRTLKTPEFKDGDSWGEATAKARSFKSMVQNLRPQARGYTTKG